MKALLGPADIHTDDEGTRLTVIHVDSTAKQDARRDEKRFPTPLIPLCWIRAGTLEGFAEPEGYCGRCSGSSKRPQICHRISGETKWEVTAAVSRTNIEPQGVVMLPAVFSLNAGSHR